MSYCIIAVNASDVLFQPDLLPILLLLSHELTFMGVYFVFSLLLLFALNSIYAHGFCSWSWRFKVSRDSLATLTNDEVEL